MEYDYFRKDLFRYDVFISHSSKDKTFVRDVATNLRKDGYRVWFDEWALLKDFSRNGGTAAMIADALSHSRRLVLFNSKNAIQSSWVEFECQSFAAVCSNPFYHGYQSIIVKLDETPIPSFFSRKVVIDWSSESSNSYNLLRKGLLGEVSGNISNRAYFTGKSHPCVRNVCRVVVCLQLIVISNDEVYFVYEFIKARVKRGVGGEGIPSSSWEESSSALKISADESLCTEIDQQNIRQVVFQLTFRA